MRDILAGFCIPVKKIFASYNTEMEPKQQNLTKVLGRLSTLLVLLLLTSAIWLRAGKTENSGLFVRFLDVGQGDAELIQTPDHKNILIDGGPDDKVVGEIDKYVPFYSRKIDSVILTHPHADHVSGLNTVLDKYQVSNIYFTGVVYTSPPYIKFLQEIKDKKISAHDVKAGDYLDLGSGIRLDFLYPLKNIAETTAGNMNNTSIVNRLVYGNEKVIFMGDLENDAQQELLASGQELTSTILKVAHHGSKTGTNSSFLQAVNPQYAVIEVGKKNQFGHPHAETLKLLSGRQVFRTDQEGSISYEIGKSEVTHLR